MGYIYNATNKINGKGYVGQTIYPVQKRLKEHQQKNSGCRAFHGAIKKYGWKNFVIDWYECSDDELNKHEKWMVNLMGTLSPNGYNLREGGGSKGKMSEESKQKMSESTRGEKNPNYGKIGEKNHNFGKKQSNETRQKKSESLKGDRCYWYGKTQSKEHKQKNRESHLGKTPNNETRQKISEAQRGEKNHNSKRVYQYTLDGAFIDSFGSTGEAARHLKKNDGSKIRACARGDSKSAYKFKWSYTLDMIM